VNIIQMILFVKNQHQKVIGSLTPHILISPTQKTTHVNATQRTDGSMMKTMTMEDVSTATPYILTAQSVAILLANCSVTPVDQTT